MLIIYEFFLFVYMICYLPILVIRGKWHNGFIERLGFIPGDKKDKLIAADNIWVHAVSVGEVTAIAELIKRIKQRYPKCQIVLTVSTKAGYELARNKFSHSAVILWSPLDFTACVDRFLAAIGPRIYIVAETELWPNLFHKLHRKGIPIILVNGRISDKSVRKYLKIRWFLKPFLGLIKSFCMQSQLDAERIINMGAPVDRVKNVGNVKFDDSIELNQTSSFDRFFLPEEQLWIAGSTHPGEEEIVLEVLKRVRKNFPLLRLVIAPRHAERSGEVIEIVASKGFESIKYTQLTREALKPGSVIVVDAIGHLRLLYSLATIVFVGKSLTVQGGHNIIEPAYFAKPVIIGPHMQNFRDVTAAFKQSQAIMEVENVEQLTQAVETLLSHPLKMSELGRKAKAVIEANKGATQRILEELGVYMDKVA